MKINQIECVVLLVPDYDSAAGSSAQDDIVVFVHTDEGLTGIGEVDTNPWVAKAMVEARGTHNIGQGLTEMLLGQDPLQPESLWEKMSPIPIAAGAMLNTRFEFQELMDRGKVDVVQPDVGRVGGFTEAKRVCDMAGDRGKSIVPHCWKTGIGIAASAHLAVATTHCPYIEFLPAHLAESVLRRELTLDELHLADGKIPLPKDPGLGIQLNPDALRKYRVNP